MGTSFSDRLDGQALLMIIISNACPPKKRCAESLYPFIPLIVFGMGIVVYICKTGVCAHQTTESTFSKWRSESPGSSVRTQMYFRFSLCLKGDVVSLNVVFCYTFRATSVQPFCFCFCLFLIA